MIGAQVIVVQTGEGIGITRVARSISPSQTSCFVCVCQCCSLPAAIRSNVIFYKCVYVDGGVREVRVPSSHWLPTHGAGIRLTQNSWVLNLKKN